MDGVDPNLFLAMFADLKLKNTVSKVLKSSVTAPYQKNTREGGRGELDFFHGEF